MRYGADVSNYQWQFSPSDAEALARLKCSFAFIGRQRVNIWASQQAQYMRDAGIKHIAEYLESVGGAWPELFPETVYVAIAVEYGSEFCDEASIDNALLWVRQQGRIPIIYSSAYMWVERLGLSSLTKYGEEGILLWNAHYDGQTNGYDLPVPFGGWTRCAIDQYTDGWVDGGLAYPLDMNDCEDDLFWDAVAPAPEPVLTQPAAAPIMYVDYQIPSQKALVVAYALGKTLGEGKVGKIFRAKDDPLEPNVAWYIFGIGKDDVSKAFVDGSIP
jgi:hypothetical protein